MGIERNNRKPKRKRTVAQRLKGRRQPHFELPDGVPASQTSDKKAGVAKRRPKSDIQ